MITGWRLYLRDHPRVVDVALVLLLFANSIPGSILTAPFLDVQAPWWPAVMLSGIACTALLWRRSRPRAVAVVAVLCAMAVAALGYILTVLLLGPLMLALYTVASRSDRKISYIFTFGAVLLVAGTAMLAGPPGDPLELKTIGPIAWLLVPAAIGYSVKVQRAYLEVEKARAEYAERTREEEAAHRVAEERMRIARELHDVVAHHLALANAQAGAVAHLIRSHPDQAEKIVGDLTGTTSSALRELKATVGLLRQPDDADAPLEPAPGLDRVPELAGSFGSAGLEVTVTTEGEPQPLSPMVDLTAYRIVQEALTNVAKHAATAAAEVNLTYHPNRLSITVTNDAGHQLPAATAAGPGYGLIGMRERALSVGGQLRAGPRESGGFEVAAELPTAEERTS